MLAPSLLVLFRPVPGILCNHKANKAGKVLERDEERVAPSHSVPFRPVQSTLCNNKANMAGKMSERGEEEEQKPKHSAEPTFVQTVLASDDTDGLPISEIHTKK